MTGSAMVVADVEEAVAMDLQQGLQCIWLLLYFTVVDEKLEGAWQRLACSHRGVVMSCSEWVKQNWVLITHKTQYWSAQGIAVAPPSEQSRGILVSLTSFLHFITGSTVMPSVITVTFTNLVGALRSPVAHTCSNTLELPSTYVSLQDLKREFLAILRDPINFQMDIA